MYTQVAKGNYEIKYIFKNGFKYKDIEIQIFSDGKFKKTNFSYHDNVSDKIEEGYYSKNDIAEFIRYAIRHNVLKMNDNMNADDDDGSIIFFEIRIGEKNIKAGGYEPRVISDDFVKIWRKFNELNYETIVN